MASEDQIEQVSRVLSEWNPLGSSTDTALELYEYRTEAEDILFDLELSGSKANIAETVRDVLNETFALSLSIDECLQVAGKISAILKERWKSSLSLFFYFLNPPTSALLPLSRKALTFSKPASRNQFN